ncbi:MAG: uncharacterized protein KVP18_003990 [Porospora cf. gigantea A]|uniref:uncharacterized protein n=1 Tax=Porospora cf. gigantea A TaxID=2853593 RepID=UPI00355A75FC|nr:MAG: hypothetical protein KVP18_003990 [Porospora cf. gigantea A]
MRSLWLSSLLLVWAEETPKPLQRAPFSEELYGKGMDVIVNWDECATAQEHDAGRLVHLLDSIVNQNYHDDLTDGDLTLIEFCRVHEMGRAASVRLPPELTHTEALAVLVSELREGLPDETAAVVAFTSVANQAYVHVHAGPEFRRRGVAFALALAAVIIAHTDDSGTYPSVLDVIPTLLPSLMVDLVPTSLLNGLIIRAFRVLPCVLSVEEAAIREPYPMQNIVREMANDWREASKSYNDPVAFYEWANAGGFGAHFMYAWKYALSHRTHTSRDVQPVAVVDTECARNPDYEFYVIKNCGTAFGAEMPCEGYNAIDGTFDFSYHGEVKLHGTPVSGIIASIGNNGRGLIGGCPTCKIHCIRAADDSGIFTSSGLLSAYEHILSHIEELPISNHSYGGGRFVAAEYLALKKLTEAGHIVVTAAGNAACSDSNPACEKNYPASYELPRLFSVGASDIFGQRAFFSNYGDSVDVFAPGTDNLVLTTHDPNKIGLQNGSSFSAAFVTAALANGLALRPEAGLDKAVQALKTSATRVQSADGSEIRLLNAYKLLQEMEMESPSRQEAGNGSIRLVVAVLTLLQLVLL